MKVGEIWHRIDDHESKVKILKITFVEDMDELDDIIEDLSMWIDYPVWDMVEMKKCYVITAADNFSDKYKFELPEEYFKKLFEKDYDESR